MDTVETEAQNGALTFCRRVPPIHMHTRTCAHTTPSWVIMAVLHVGSGSLPDEPELLTQQLQHVCACSAPRGSQDCAFTAVR